MTKNLVKKICGLLVLAAFLCAAGSLGAQEKRKRFALSLDTVPFFRGFIASGTSDTAVRFIFGLAEQFEWACTKNLGILQRLDVYQGPGSYSYFGWGTHMRFYPLSNGLENLFLDAGITFQIENGNTEGFSMFAFSMKAGWKMFLGKTFFFEPALGYVYSKPGITIGKESGWQLAFPLGLAF